MTPVEMVGADKVTRKQRLATPTTVPVSLCYLCGTTPVLPARNERLCCVSDAVKTGFAAANDTVAKYDYPLAHGPEH